MKYIITENRLVDFVDKYFENNIGKLRKFPLTHINAREDDFQIVDENMDTVFRYMDYHLGVEEKLFYHMMKNHENGREPPRAEQIHKRLV